MNNNFCSSCGGNLTGGNNCPNCGAPVLQDNSMNMQQNMGMPEMNQTMVQGNPGMSVPNTGEGWKNKNAVTAIILETISFFIFGFLAPVGLCLAIQGFRESKEHNGQGKNLSIAGIVIGVIFTIFYIVALVNN